MRMKRARIEHLERYLANEEYDRALEAVTSELERDPRQFNLLLRQADILGMAGNRERAIALYRQAAEKQARDGFYARSIALYKKVLRLDPNLDEVHTELARLIEEDRQSKLPLEQRLRRSDAATATAPGSLEAAEPEDDRQHRELQASTLFTAFGERPLREVISSTLLRSFDEGDIIVTEGEVGASLFLIVSGEVKVFTRGERGEHLPLAELGAGDFFGEVSLLTGKPRTATITARSPVEAIELTREDVDRIAAEHPEVPGILEEFYNRRAHQTVEAVIQRMRQRE
jgi:cAMP-dependent protein kinase regulator